MVGLLFGNRGIAGNTVVIDATDAIYEVEPSGRIAFNSVDMETKIRLWTAMGEDQTFLGWYSFGSSVSTDHVTTHSEVL